MRARVWAPRPEMVRVQIDGTVHPMTAGDDGWWEGPELTPGARYGFLIDDDPTPRPDPRGRSLPDGVHGLSEAVDAAELAEIGTDDERDWRGRAHGGERAVIYELHIGTFTADGTFDSAIERLDYLADLGVGFIEILPVNGFNGTHNWGYDGVAWFAVHEGYGGPAGYRRLVAAAHARGLGVIQDVVYNHLGPSGNYLPLYGPYLHSGSSNTWGDSINLDELEVRRYILDNAAMWMGEYGVDGLRLDAVHALVDSGSTGTHILAELGAETDELSARLGRPLTLIAESDLNDPIMFTDRVEGGHGLTAQWSDDYHHAVHVAVSGETAGYYADFADPTALGKVWSRGFFHDGTFSSFREREHGRPVPPDIEPWRLVTFSQDHDQIGNRAAGDRLTASLSPERLSVAAVLTVLAPGAPMLFMGEEWGAKTPWQFFTSHPEPELGTATAEGRIAEFEKMGWDPDAVPDPQDPATFANSKLDWSELDEPEHALLLEQYRTLIQLRDELPTPERMSDLSAEPGPHPGTWRLGRAGATVLINLGETDWNVGPVDEMLFTTDASLQLSGLVLPPESAVVLR